MELYKDKFVTLHEDELVIKTYYFPVGTNVTIKTKDIVGVYYDEQKFMKDCGKIKGWGMSLNPVWWACDLKRGISSKNFNVVVDTGEWTKKGFSVVDIADFLEALRDVVDPTVEFRKGIPFDFPETVKDSESDKVGIIEKQPIHFEDDPKK
uniref:Uncharacterized protein n=1 Tax=Panagrolaimus sp. JU765 TaxID=591449 RepID=A0AC34RD42_9BILA